MIREAKRTAPSIVYVPHIHLWWEIVGPTLKATFTTLLQNIPSFAPVLLLATSDKPHSSLPEEVICGGKSLNFKKKVICIKVIRTYTNSKHYRSE